LPLDTQLGLAVELLAQGLALDVRTTAPSILPNNAWASSTATSSPEIVTTGTPQ
jgi:hypothetical protein